MREAGRGGSSLVSKLPSTPIQPDSTWSAEVHLGYEYAALLVDPDYHPPATMDVYPTAGGSVIVVKTATGESSLPPLPTEPKLDALIPSIRKKALRGEF